MKKVVRLGDSTSHGGTVVSASPSTTVMGKPVARLGDTVTCPMPGHGTNSIVEAEPTWTVDGGVAVALDGHKTACGAALISSAPSTDKG
ncbi:PAAR domain-containing protein [Andreprevotia chitinilytica]|uniref:PAAR domain-containing protein n=1 Tax=Andreprevotia chitinilytica TaxID=396808 RepID=UPI0005542DCC|nr:PAAR domain-containing protein [Andreprevotia chitinilytica]